MNAAGEKSRSVATYKTFEAAKSGVEEYRNEDSIQIKTIASNALMIAMSDGASTGVFSKEWSDHITGGIDSAWLQSPATLERGLQFLRESFQPDVSRPTALRKFLMEGSYATLLIALIQRSRWWFGRLVLTLFGIGDVSLFIFTPEGELEYVFPPTVRDGFGNTPEMIRSSERLQNDSPYTIHHELHRTRPENLIVIASDALAEHINGLPPAAGLRLARQIGRCTDDAEFRLLVQKLRETRGMKNDDVTVCLITAQPDDYFRPASPHSTRPEV